MIRLLFLLILVLLSGCSSDENINSECASQNKDSLIARFQCVQRRAKEEREWKKEMAKQEAKDEKERMARGCIAGDISRMEGLVSDAKKLVTENSTLNDVKTKFETLFKTPYISVVPASDNIKEMVVVETIPTKCASDFNLLINVRFNEDGQVKSFNVWSETSPEGYPSGLNKDLSVNYAQLRVQRAKAQIDAASRNNAPSNTGDHCAANLSKATRLARLSQYGVVRQSSQNYYSAGTHGVEYNYFNDMKSCW